MSAEREPGFAGLIADGTPPAEAWQQVRDSYTADPGARAVIDQMRADPEGRAALAWSRAMWADHGLTPPWEEPQP